MHSLPGSKLTTDFLQGMCMDETTNIIYRRDPKRPCVLLPVGSPAVVEEAIQRKWMTYPTDHINYRFAMDMMAGTTAKFIREVMFSRIVLPRVVEAPGEPFVCDNGVFVRLPPFGPRLYSFQVRAALAAISLARTISLRAGVRAEVPGARRQRDLKGSSAARPYRANLPPSLAAAHPEFPPVAFDAGLFGARRRRVRDGPHVWVCTRQAPSSRSRSVRRIAIIPPWKWDPNTHTHCGIILIGQSGTGKTAFCDVLARAIETYKTSFIAGTGRQSTHFMHGAEKATTVFINEPSRNPEEIILTVEQIKALAGGDFLVLNIKHEKAGAAVRILPVFVTNVLPHWPV